eukprot:1720463-Alexandrium_andersonii.AAC.1
MSASLVGSEMCIRDRTRGQRRFDTDLAEGEPQPLWGGSAQLPSSEGTVSYTHLTLPTICSV